MTEPNTNQSIAGDRFPPTTKDLLSEHQRVVYESIEARRGKVPEPYLALLGSPDLADLFEQYSARLWRGVLPAHILEAIFLAIARQYRCRYQWLTHVQRATDAGLTVFIIAAIGKGQVPRGEEDVVAVLRFVDMLVREHKVTQEVFNDVMLRLKQPGMAELLAFCGVAASIAMLLNVKQPKLPHGEAPF